MSSAGKILVVVTNADQYEKVGYRTGLWLSELTHFWDVAQEAGHAMDIASPLGGMTPLDPESLHFSQVASVLGMSGSVANHYADRSFMNLLNDTLPIEKADVAGYEAIYLTGGHGTMFDFPESAALASALSAFWRAGKVVSAVCHGPAGLLGAKIDGDYLVRGKKVTGFSWVEEIGAGREKAVPFSLEDELRARGGEYEKGFAPFLSHVVADGRLITGQNPASAEDVGKAVVAALAATRAAA